MFLQKLLPANFLLVASLLGEVHPFTLPEVVSTAARQNPDVALARLEQQRAEEGIRIAQDPFRPKVFGGSGLAYTYGYPNSIDGNAPSLFQIKTEMALFNRPKSYQLASAREIARGSQMGAQAKADEVGYQAADLFLTANQLEHQATTLDSQLPSLRKVLDSMTAAVGEGSQLPIEQKRARVNLAMAEQRLSAVRLDADYYEMLLATFLGYSATDRVKPVPSELSTLDAPSEEEAADTALENNRELRQMQSNVLAKELDVRSYKAMRLPQVDLVAQYSLFAKYNYVQYFQKFQHNNAQIGASVTIPILVGSASRAYAEQAYTDMQKIRIQMDQVRNRVLSDTRRSYDQWKKAQSIRDLARMQLDLAREDLTVLLAQNGEGRVPMSRVEQARLEEGDRWLAFYDAEAQVVRAKLAILRQTGSLLASVRALAPDSKTP